MRQIRRHTSTPFPRIFLKNPARWAEPPGQARTRSPSQFPGHTAIGTKALGLLFLRRKVANMRSLSHARAITQALDCGWKKAELNHRPLFLGRTLGAKTVLPRFLPRPWSVSAAHSARFADEWELNHGQWCPGAELNHRHRDFQSRALPTELPGRRLAVVALREKRGAL